MKTLAQYGPWGLAAALGVLLRKELILLLRAPRDDRAMEQALLRMGDQFALNLEMFDKTTRLLDSVLTELKESNVRQERLLLEIVRRRGDPL